MIVNKHGQEVRYQLSDGEKCLIALAVDLARRLAIANPPLKNPLEGEGVVLIDEVDLHLHPMAADGIAEADNNVPELPVHRVHPFAANIGRSRSQPNPHFDSG